MSDDRHILMRVMARHLLASAVELPPEGVDVLARLAADEFRRTHSRTASARDVQAFLHQSPILSDIANRMPWAWGDFHQAFNRHLRASFAQRVAQSLQIAGEAKFKDKKEVPKADGSGTTTVYEYSDRQVAKRHNDKAKRIEKLRKSMGDLRSKVTGDLDNKDPNIRLVALAVALMDETYERVGNDGSAKDGHFGVTGWKVKHITFSQGKATMKYVGKSGVKQEKVVTNSKALKVLKAATQGKSPDEEILCDGDDCRITASHVNDYLEPFDITAKDLRGLHANEEMRSRLKSQRSKGGKLPTDQKAKKEKLKAEWDKALEGAADAVGHEASTLKSQYLVPGLEDEYLKHGTVPATLDKTAIISLNNATDGAEDGDMELRGFMGLISSLTLFEQAVVQDMDIHGEPIIGSEGSYTLRGRKVQDDVVGELVGSGYLEETPKGVVLSPMFQAKQKLYTASAALVEQWGPTMHVGTKSDADVEDEEVERLVRPAPKKKPPRKDLRRQRMDTDTDKEPDAEQDRKDQSQNHKDIGASLVSRLAYIHLTAKPNRRQRKKNTKKEQQRQKSGGSDGSGGEPSGKGQPNSIWTTDEGKIRAKDKDGKAQNFDTQEKAKAWLDGGGKAGQIQRMKEKGKKTDPSQTPDDLKAKAEEKAKEKAEAKAKAQKAKAIKETLGKVDVIVDDLGGKVEKNFDNFDGAQKKEMAASYEAAIDALVDKPPTGKAMQTLAGLAEAAPGPGVVNDPKKLGEFLAKQQYAKKVLTNPLLVGGRAVSEDTTAVKGKGGKPKATQEQMDHAHERGVEAYQQYSSLTTKQRDDAFYKLYAEYEDSEPGSPKNTELRGLMNGVTLSMAMAGEDVPYMAHVPQSYGKLGQMLKAQGDGNELKLLSTVSALGSGESRQVINSLLEDMTDGDLAEIAGGQAGHLGGWVDELLGTGEGGPLQAKQQSAMRKAVRDRVLDTMTFTDPLIGEVLKSQGVEVTDEAVAGFHSAEPGGLFGAKVDQAHGEAVGEEDFAAMADERRVESLKDFLDKLEPNESKLSPRGEGLWAMLLESGKSGLGVINDGINGPRAVQMALALDPITRMFT